MFDVSTLVCVILFPVSIAVPAIVTLAVLDSMTTIAGLSLGQHRIYNGKSLEGTTAGIVVTTIVLLAFMSLTGAVAVAVLAGIKVLPVSNRHEVIAKANEMI
jgi:dolichol kinase